MACIMFIHEKIQVVQLKLQCDMCIIRFIDKIQLLQNGQFDIHIMRFVDKSTIQCNISVMMVEQYRSEQ